MSDTLFSYPHAPVNSLFLSHHTYWGVREDEDPTSLVGLADAITERLAKAEALIRILQGNQQDLVLDALPNAAWAIGDLIHEARELYTKQWQQMRRYAKTEN